MKKPKMNRSQIICTLGPASASMKVLAGMMQAGMDVVRLNFSHGTHAAHLQKINSIRKMNAAYDCGIKILQDLEGYRIRIGALSGRSDRIIPLTQGEQVYLTNQSAYAQEMIPFDYQGALSDIPSGCFIYIDDGYIALKVKSRSKTYIKAEVITPGIIKEHKGLNIPDIKLRFTGLKEKDRLDLLFGIEHQVDYVAQSFVRNADDILAIRAVLDAYHFKGKVIAKIENREGIANLGSILKVCDGIMIARGDMGVSLPIYEVPLIQKQIIKACKEHKKFVITATQMLESMTENLRPTRAEVSDVANAILDGSDYVMLSGETAVGKHPVATVQMMDDIIGHIEAFLAKPGKG